MFTHCKVENRTLSTDNCSYGPINGFSNLQIKNALQTSIQDEQDNIVDLSNPQLQFVACEMCVKKRRPGCV